MDAGSIPATSTIVGTSRRRTLGTDSVRPVVLRGCVSTTKGGTVTAPPFVVSWVSRSLEGVLDLFAGGLEVALGLLDLALGLQVLVVGGVAEGLLDHTDYIEAVTTP